MNIENIHCHYDDKGIMLSLQQEDTECHLLGMLKFWSNTFNWIYVTRAAMIRIASYLSNEAQNILLQNLIGQAIVIYGVRALLKT